MRAKLRAEPIKAKLASYEDTAAGFTWDQAWRDLEADPRGPMNLARQAVDRWALRPRHAVRTALWFSGPGWQERFSFARLREESCRWANLLASVGLGRGDVLAMLLPPRPEFWPALLACARMGAVAAPLRPGAPPWLLAQMMRRSRPAALLTHPDLADLVPGALPDPDLPVIWTGRRRPGVAARETAAHTLLPHMDSDYPTADLPPDWPFYLAWYDQPQGPPQAALHCHRAMAGYLVTARWALNLGRDSLIWTDSMPHGIAGVVYGAIAPWLCGAASLAHHGRAEPAEWLATMRRRGVTTWYTNPTRIRQLMAASQPEQTRHVPSLEHVATMGEQLSLEEFFWVRNNMGRAPHETWWTVETGMICVANFPAMDIRIGSIGRTMPGVETGVICCDGTAAHPLCLGELGVASGVPAMMSGLQGRPGGLAPRLSQGRWLMSGDQALQDEDGYLYLQGRRDDLVRGAGRMVGPFEVESVLLELPAVERAVAVAGPGPDGGAAVKGFVTLGGGAQPGADMERRLADMARSRLSRDVRLDYVRILDRLPTGANGALLRRALRALDLGLPLGRVDELAADDAPITPDDCSVSTESL